MDTEQRPILQLGFLDLGELPTDTPNARQIAFVVIPHPLRLPARERAVERDRQLWALRDATIDRSDHQVTQNSLCSGSTTTANVSCR